MNMHEPYNLEPIQLVLLTLLLHGIHQESIRITLNFEERKFLG